MNVLNLHETTEHDLWQRSMKVAVCLVPALVVGAEAVRTLSRGFGEPGDAIRIVLIFGVPLLLPALLYAALIRTKVPAVCVGVVLVALQIWGFWSFYAADGLEALVVYWIPVAGVPLVLVGWSIDVWIRAMRPLSPPV